jgi:hypothetical protein
MRRTLSLLIAGVAGALIALLALSLATNAFAQGPAGPPAQVAPGAGPAGHSQMMGRGQPMGGRADSLVGMAAARLGLSQAELVAQLGAGGRITDALTAGGVEPAAFIDEFVASRAERLDADVAAGTLTREQADARLATARSMAAARIAQPFTAGGAGGRGAGQGPGFVDEDGDGVCDLMPAGGQARQGGGRGPRR